MKKIDNTATALLQFEDAAIKQAEATERGDYKSGNKCYLTITKAVSFLKEHNEIQRLSEFLNHSAVGVRLWAATYLLPVSEDEGLQVLNQIARDSGIHSLTAMTTLSEWAKGNLTY